MPELPEVETTCRGIAPYLLNQRIIQVDVHELRLRWRVDHQQLKQQLTQQAILAVNRRAKYILLECHTGTLVIHLGMSGSLKILASQSPLAKHDHVALVLTSGLSLRLNDPRRFGSVLFQPKNQPPLPQFSHLGPEPLGPDFSGGYLYQQARNSRLAVKSFIMDQKRVVGVGNIYANESLFLAKIHPLQPAASLSPQQFTRLAQHIRTVLEKAIAQGGTTLRDFHHLDGKPGYFSQALQVYGRAGKACQRCKKKIEGLRIGQRSSFFCPGCQKLT